MFTTRSFARAAVLGSLVGTLGLMTAGNPVDARAATAGPPWISIETPVNPYDATTRNAFLLVHAFHHGTPVAVPVSGTAEGLVNGERRSVKLAFTTTSRAGAYALTNQWGDAGIWTLVIAVRQHEGDEAQALVDVGTNGEVTRVHVPTRVAERGIPLPRTESSQEIDAALRLRARSSVARR